MKWSSWFEKVHCWGRVCLHCSAFSPNNSLFCEACEKALWKRHRLSPFLVVQIGLTGKRLFDWRPDEDRMVSLLMTSLKQGKPECAFEYYAQQFFEQLPAVTIKPNSLLVPCASKQHRNHAYVFAHKLAENFDLPLANILEWKEGHDVQISQKKKRARQRKEVEFKATSLASGWHVIFIDDILTTGATAEAAKKALIGCVGFEVWCLAQRALPRQHPQDLGTLS